MVKCAYNVYTHVLQKQSTHLTRQLYIGMPNKKHYHLIFDAIAENDFVTFVQLLGTNYAENAENAMRFIKDVNSVNDTSPFLLCAKYCRYYMLKYLINIPGININQTDSNGHNALGNIILSQNTTNLKYSLRCAKLLLNNSVFNVNTLNNFNSSVLILAASDPKQYEILKLLLKHRPTSVSLTDSNGNTSLMCASMQLHALNVRLLLRHSNKITINHTNDKGRTALYLCTCYDTGEAGLQCARQLLYHADINVNRVKDKTTTAPALTLIRGKYLMNAMLMHGRI